MEKCLLVILIILVHNSFANNHVADIFLPSMQYELTRKQVHRSIFENWRSLKCNLEEEAAAMDSKFQDLKETMREHYIELMAHMNLLRAHDGLDQIRINAFETLKNIVQRKIHAMQNPVIAQRQEFLSAEQVIKEEMALQTAVGLVSLTMYSCVFCLPLHHIEHF